jgi:hypothetical protein
LIDTCHRAFMAGAHPSRLCFFFCEGWGFRAYFVSHRGYQHGLSISTSFFFSANAFMADNRTLNPLAVVYYLIYNSPSYSCLKRAWGHTKNRLTPSPKTAWTATTVTSRTCTLRIVGRHRRTSLSPIIPTHRHGLPARQSVSCSCETGLGWTLITVN